MSEKFPKISVIIPVYNSEKYLFEALESIRKQSFKDFECIIINDGSNDKSKDIINEFANSDNRFISVDSENQGTGKALNKGILKARSELIARMDADDISHPDRLKVQYKEFSKNDKLGVLGSNAIKINQEGFKVGKIREFKSNNLCQLKVFFCLVPFVHPTTMIRKEVLKDIGFYPNLLRAQDYILWNKLYSKVHFRNLKLNLLQYRVHSNQITAQPKNYDILKTQYKIHFERLVEYNINMDFNDFVFLHNWRETNKEILIESDTIQLIKEMFIAYLHSHNLNFIEKISTYLFLVKIILKRQILLKFKLIVTSVKGLFTIFFLVFFTKKH